MRGDRARGGGARGLRRSRLAEGAYLVQIGMSSSIDAAAFRRPPLNLCVVVDVSGSMREDGKLECVKKALKSLLRRLTRSDTIAIVAFNREAWTVVPPTPAFD